MELLKQLEKFDSVSDSARSRVYGLVLKHFQRHPESPWSGKYLVELEKTIKAFYASVNQEYQEVFRDTLPDVMKQFYDRAVKEIKTAGVYKNLIGDSDPARVSHFLESSFKQVAMRTDKMSFDHIQALRQLSAEVFRETSVTGATRKEVSKRLLERALEIKGFQFTDKGGNKWSNKSYFQMLARTELMNAGRASYDDKMAGEGFDIMKLTTSGDSCDRCAKYEGKPFSLTGATPGIPTKQDLIYAGVFHPNCTHSYSLIPAYIAREKYGIKDAKTQAQLERKKAEAEAFKAEQERKRKEAHRKKRLEQLERAKKNRAKRIEEAEKYVQLKLGEFDNSVETYGTKSPKIQSAKKQLIEALNSERKLKKQHALSKEEISKLVSNSKKRVISKLNKGVELAEKSLEEFKELPEYKESFPGIWFMRSPSPSEYPDLIESLEKKRKYYSDIISSRLSSKKDVDAAKESLKQLNRFEQIGKSYKEGLLVRNSEIEKARLRLEAFERKIEQKGGMFSQKRKDSAKWFTNENGGFYEANKFYEKNNAYNNGTDVQKQAAYQYTYGSGYINRPLSGFDKDWSSFVGQEKISWDNENDASRGTVGSRDIPALTELINKSKYKEDCWIQRGSSREQLSNLMGIPVNWVYEDVPELKKMLVGKEYINPAFTSCAVDKGSGFNDEIISNFYCPAGTPMLYCQPFSKYPNEHEMLLQRGLTFKITKVEKANGKVYLDIEVHPEKGLKFVKDAKDEN